MTNHCVASSHRHILDQCRGPNAQAGWRRTRFWLHAIVHGTVKNQRARTAELSVVHSLSKLASISATLLAIGWPYIAGAQDDCFTKEDNHRLQFDVFQVSAPPAYSTRTHEFTFRSPYYPASDYATSMRGLKQGPSGDGSGVRFRKHYLLWANRCSYVEGVTPNDEACRNLRTKANGYPDMVTGPLQDQLRSVYSSYDKANACTLASAMRLFGESLDAVNATAQFAGIRVVPSNTPTNELKSLSRSVLIGKGPAAVRSTALLDICVVEPEPMPNDTAGIVLDYEVFDNRTPAEVLRFVQGMQRMAHSHGKTLILNTNPLPRQPNGLDSSNVRNILDVLDGLIPTVSSGANMANPATLLPQRARKSSPLEAYREQYAVLTSRGPLTTAERAKLIWNISLYDTNLSEAQALHEEITTQHFRGLMYFRNYVRQGGACSRPSNQVTACLAFGDCHGHFGETR